MVVSSNVLLPNDNRIRVNEVDFHFSIHSPHLNAEYTGIWELVSEPKFPPKRHI